MQHPTRTSSLLNFMMLTRKQNSSVVANSSDSEDMASDQKGKADGFTPASSIASSPDATAEKHKRISQASSTPPKLGVELSELFTENVVAKIWRVAVRELDKQVYSLSPHPTQTNAF